MATAVALSRVVEGEDGLITFRVTLSNRRAFSGLIDLVLGTVDDMDGAGFRREWEGYWGPR